MVLSFGFLVIHHDQGEGDQLAYDDPDDLHTVGNCQNQVKWSVAKCKKCFVEYVGVTIMSPGGGT
jgi:hypothetical protein